MPLKQKIDNLKNKLSSVNRGYLLIAFVLVIIIVVLIAFMVYVIRQKSAEIEERAQETAPLTAPRETADETEAEIKEPAVIPQPLKERKEANFAMVVSLFNKANEFYEQGDFKRAKTDYEKVIELSGWDDYAFVAYVNLGNIYFSENDIESAFKCYEYASKIKTDHTVLYNLALVSYEKGAVNQTIRYLTELERINPDSLESGMLYVKSLIKLNEKDKALQKAIYVFSNFPDSPDAEYMLAYAHFLNGNYANVLDLIKEDKMKELDASRKIKNLSLLAESAFNLNRFELAKNYYETLYRMSSEDISKFQKEALFNMGVTFMRLNNIKDAEKVFLYLTSDYKNEPVYFTHLSEIYILKKEFEKALSPLMRALEIDTSNQRNYYQLGWVFQNLNRYEEALKTYDDALRINSSNSIAADCYLNKAICYDALKNYDKAVEAVKTAIGINPSASNYYNAGLIHEHKGDLSQALSIYKRAYEMAPSNPLYLRGYADMLYKLQNNDEAATHYEKLIAVSPADIYGYYMAGLVHTRLRNFAKAKQYYNRALQLSPPRETAYAVNLNLGSIHLTEGKNEEAEKYFLQSASIIKDKADAYYMLGRLYLDTNRINDALASAQTALSFSKTAEVYNLIGYIYYQRGIMDKAEEYFKLALEIDKENAEAKFNLKEISNLR